MNCPKCSGAAMIPGRLLIVASTETNPNQLYPCDYEGCHAGLVHCCDGLEEGDNTVFVARDKWAKKRAERQKQIKGFAGRLQLALTHRKKKQSDLAKATDVEQPSASAWIRGKKNKDGTYTYVMPTHEKVMLMAEFLEVDINWLYVGLNSPSWLIDKDNVGDAKEGEDEWTLEVRWVGHNEEIPEGFKLANEKESHHTRHSRLVVREYDEVG